MPPSAMPSASRLHRRCRPSVSSMRGASGGGSPPSTQSSKWRSAALATTWNGPSLIGTPQSIVLGGARADEVSVGVRGARAPPTAGSGRCRVGAPARELRTPTTSLSVWMSRTGRRCRCGRSSVRRRSSRRCRPPCPARTSGRPGRAAAVHEEAVERLRERLHAVEVGHERERRLRLAGRDARARARARRAPPPARTARATCVKMSNAYRRRDARGCRSARGRCALRPLPAASRAGHVDLDGHGPALDADELRRDADPHVALTRTSPRASVVYSGSASTPPLTFSHSRRPCR